MVKSQAFRPRASCAQSVTIPLAALGTQYGEGFEIWAETPRPLQVQVELQEQGEEIETATTFVESRARPSNERCLVGAPVAVGVEGDGAGNGARGGTPGGPATVASVTAAQDVIVLDPLPPPGHATKLMDFERDTSPCHDDGAFSAGTPMGIRLWSTEPIDWSGVTLYVVQTKVVPKGNERDFRADRKKECDEAIAEAMRESEKPSPPPSAHAEPVEPPSKKLRSPPAAKVEVIPPRPSLQVEWIAGFWRESETAEIGWEWVGGHWGPIAGPAAASAQQGAAPGPVIIVVPPQPRIVIKPR